MNRVFAAHLTLCWMVCGCFVAEKPSDTLAQRADEILTATSDWLGIKTSKSPDFSALLTLKTEVVSGRGRARGLLILPADSTPDVVVEQLDRVLTNPEIVRVTNVVLVVARSEAQGDDPGALLGAGFYAADGRGWSGDEQVHRRVILGRAALKELGIGR